MVTSLPYITETTREPSSGGQEINSLTGSCLMGSRRLWGRPCASSGLFAGGFIHHSHSTERGRGEWQAVCPSHQGGGTFPSSHMPTLSLLPLSPGAWDQEENREQPELMVPLASAFLIFTMGQKQHLPGLWGLDRKSFAP